MDDRPIALQRLADNGHDFTLYQAVILLESYRLKEELRYVVRPSSELSFPAGEIRRCRIDEDGLWVIEANVFALIGQGSPLPHYWIEQAAAAEPSGERLRSLLGLINERVYNVLTDAWCSVYGTSADCLWVSSWGSLAVSSNQTNNTVTALDLFFQRRATNHGLKSLVQRLSGVMAVRVLDKGQQGTKTWVLGRGYAPLGGRGGLTVGEDFSLGGKALLAGGKTKIVIGPLQHSDAVKLAPGSELGQEMSRWIGLYLGPRRSVQVELLIAAGERKAWFLSEDQGSLGITTWLGSKSYQQSSLLFSITTH